MCVGFFLFCEVHRILIFADFCALTAIRCSHNRVFARVCQDSCLRFVTKQKSEIEQFSQIQTGVSSQTLSDIVIAENVVLKSKPDFLNGPGHLGPLQSWLPARSWRRRALMYTRSSPVAMPKDPGHLEQTFVFRTPSGFCPIGPLFPHLNGSVSDSAFFSRF